MTSFATPCEPALLEHVRAHQQVLVPVPAGVGAVRADPADVGREVVHDLRPRVARRAARRRPSASGRTRRAAATNGSSARPRASRSTRCEPRNPPPPVTRISRHAVCAGSGCSQSTRPIQRSRFSAYQWIVRRTPSSQLDLRLPARLAVQLLVADAERHHLARARPEARRRWRRPRAAGGPEAVLLAGAEDQRRTSRPSRCSRPGRRRRRRRGCPGPRPSGAHARRRCRSRSRAAGRAGRARPPRARAPA